MNKFIICLLGPTAAGKTPLAVEMVRNLPCDIISVDSAMVYRGMDIGTAKPDAETQKIAPHRLIDICDPKEIYSAGQFREDAVQEIAAIHAQQRIPLLVGGTMMYFRVLQQGLANLPQANPDLRAELTSRAEKEGWESLHAWLASIDANSAKRINPNDSQRIQRALEVYLLTGKNISTIHQESHSQIDYPIYNFALAPANRVHLHEKIEKRFDQMLDDGFVDEVKKLFDRGDLHQDLPSIRSVGYSQVWEYLQGKYNHDEMREKAIIATRQLAKRQMTWLRSWSSIQWLDSEDAHLLDRVMKNITKNQV